MMQGMVVQCCLVTVAYWLLDNVSDFAAHHAGVPVVVLHGPGFVPGEETQ